MINSFSAKPVLKVMNSFLRNSLHVFPAVVNIGWPEGVHPINKKEKKGTRFISFYLFL